MDFEEQRFKRPNERSSFGVEQHLAVNVFFHGISLIIRARSAARARSASMISIVHGGHCLIENLLDGFGGQDTAAVVVIGLDADVLVKVHA